MIERGGDVVIRMLENVQQVTIKPLIQATIVPGSLVYTDEYDIYSRLEAWGYDHESVCHSAGEYAPMTTVTAFLKSISIPWKGFGRF
jgi:transposase